MSINKIKKSKDFSLIYNKSKKMHTKYAIIFIKEKEKKIMDLEKECKIKAEEMF